MHSFMLRCIAAETRILFMHKHRLGGSDLAWVERTMMYVCIRTPLILFFRADRDACEHMLGWAKHKSGLLVDHQWWCVYVP